MVRFRRGPYQAQAPGDRTLRVWSSGRDITDEDPRTWGWPYADWWEQGWRPESGPNCTVVRQAAQPRESE